ncbi:hypothetical protein [Haloarchaeobius sp. TZWWS8]|uniref:hypothetical protein n=1 Tax=Haloarchaeobius sp. TZWWS8 TaxID=3446121 RepID=UPI003EB7C365
MGDSRHTPSEKAILSALDAVPAMHVSELASALGCESGRVESHCYRLQGEQKVRHRDGGYYSITATGEQRLRVLLRSVHTPPQPS